MRELFLGTARERSSIDRIAKQVGYRRRSSMWDKICKALSREKEEIRMVVPLDRELKAGEALRFGTDSEFSGLFVVKSVEHTLGASSMMVVKAGFGARVRWCFWGYVRCAKHWMFSLWDRLMFKSEM